MDGKRRRPAAGFAAGATVVVGPSRRTGLRGSFAAATRTAGPRAAAGSLSPAPSAGAPTPFISFEGAERAAAGVPLDVALYLGAVELVAAMPLVRAGLGAFKILSVATKLAHQSLFPEVALLESAFHAAGWDSLAARVDMIAGSAFGATDDYVGSGGGNFQFHIDPLEQNTHELVDNCQNPEGGPRRTKKPARPSPAELEARPLRPARAAAPGTRLTGRGRQALRQRAAALIEVALERGCRERLEGGLSAVCEAAEAHLEAPLPDADELVLARWELDLALRLPGRPHLTVRGLAEYALLEEPGAGLALRPRLERWDNAALQAAVDLVSRRRP
eukprot:tig00000881_g5228.t1